MEIPEEINNSFEELWQEHRLEFEKAEADALNHLSVDDTPIIKVFQKILFALCPYT